MKLYYAQTSSSIASFIAATFAGINLETEPVLLHKQQTASGVDYHQINPKGSVPCLVLDDGNILNENCSILQYLADQVPGRIAPVCGSIPRSLTQNVMSFVSSEVQVFQDLLFDLSLEEEVQTFLRDYIMLKLKYIETHVLFNNGQQYVVENKFSIADCLLYSVLKLCPIVGIDLTPYVHIQAYMVHVAALPKVIEAEARIAVSAYSTC